MLFYWPISYRLIRAAADKMMAMMTIVEAAGAARADAGDKTAPPAGYAPLGTQASMRRLRRLARETADAS